MRRLTRGLAALFLPAFASLLLGCGDTSTSLPTDTKTAPPQAAKVEGTPDVPPPVVPPSKLNPR